TSASPWLSCAISSTTRWAALRPSGPAARWGAAASGVVVSASTNAPRPYARARATAGATAATPRYGCSVAAGARRGRTGCGAAPAVRPGPGRRRGERAHPEVRVQGDRVGAERAGRVQVRIGVRVHGRGDVAALHVEQDQGAGGPQVAQK